MTCNAFNSTLFVLIIRWKRKERNAKIGWEKKNWIKKLGDRVKMGRKIEGMGEKRKGTERERCTKWHGQPISQ